MTLPLLKQVSSPNFSARNGGVVDLVVLHDTEGGYSGSVGWFTNAHSKVSAHLVLKEDGSETTQCVALSQKAWHCVQFNSRSVGLEMAGFAKIGYGENEWQAAANIIAYLLAHYRIPVRWAHGGDGPGFCRHYDLGAAGGGHCDPTVNGQLWDDFVARVQKTTPDTEWEGLRV